MQFTEEHEQFASRCGGSSTRRSTRTSMNGRRSGSSPRTRSSPSSANSVPLAWSTTRSMGAEARPLIHLRARAGARAHGLRGRAHGDRGRDVHGDPGGWRATDRRSSSGPTSSPPSRGEMVCSIAVSEPDGWLGCRGLRTRAVRATEMTGSLQDARCGSPTARKPTGSACLRAPIPTRSRATITA